MRSRVGSANWSGASVTESGSNCTKSRLKERRRLKSTPHCGTKDFSFAAQRLDIFPALLTHSLRRGLYSYAAPRLKLPERGLRICPGAWLDLLWDCRDRGRLRS